MQTTSSDLGQLIRQLRKKHNLTLHQVALGVDVDSPLLSKIERGERFPTLEQAKKIAVFFNVDEDEFLAKLTAGKIIKEYGISEVTLNAVLIVQEQIEEMKYGKND